jgi:WD40 repeat protein
MGPDSQMWDLRVKRSVRTFNENYQVLSVAFSDGGDQIYAAGIEGVVKVWDLRREEVVTTLKGHTDTVTGMRLSPDGTHLLTNSMDNSLRIWDMRPYAPENRCIKARDGNHSSSFSLPHFTNVPPYNLQMFLFSLFLPNPATLLSSFTSFLRQVILLPSLSFLPILSTFHSLLSRIILLLNHPSHPFHLCLLQPSPSLVLQLFTLSLNLDIDALDRKTSTGALYPLSVPIPVI